MSKNEKVDDRQDHEWWCAGTIPGAEDDAPCAGRGCDWKRAVA